ncbi:AMP-dependent synthetase [Pseudoxanthomonas kalamensis DSM 18571]|uniref:class I adenylate-forming enzyme family protein n=1 Tax=Pseudoxanthomonas kalamensis TaxID=289483 RepID=UPI001390CED7|nr:AMP-binding protein [Pseudoxanthomonas kalamensis]KAF1709771.1 AMP-dependent synthetase [Pseudoxanthomonas kalamensis DSM 18571]
MNLALWLQRAARHWPDAPALMLGERVLLDYAGFQAQAVALGTALQRHCGITAGERVALFLPNCPQYLPILYGTWHAGGAVVPVNFKLHARETAWILADCGARVVFTDAAHAQTLRDACAEAEIAPRILLAEEIAGIGDEGDVPLPLQERAHDDLAWLFYTSGTTGKPKGVMISHGNLQAMTLSYLADVDEVKHTDAALYAAPMSHGAGIYNFMHVLRGARHVVPPSGGFDAREVLELAPRLGDVHMFAAPTMVAHLTAEARALGGHGEGIRTIVYGGGPMYLADIEEALATMGPRFVQIYGQGECPMAITALSRDILAARDHPRWSARAASVGTAQSCVEVRIADTDGQPVAAGEKGEIMVRGIPVMAGYWNNPAATASALRNGWLATGDVGALDEDGFLTLMDRSKDVIISGGSNIYPREVEEALLLHPQVRAVSVIGAPSVEWGEDVVAFVEAGPTARDAAELDRHCLEHIARFKRPKRYVFVDELPKNHYGKVLKTELRRLLMTVQD